MKLGNLKNPVADAFYRCAGPNCGILKKTADRWWLEACPPAMGKASPRYAW